MSAKHGIDGVVYIGSNAIASVLSFTYDETADVAESKIKGTTATGHTAGHTKASGTIECEYDADDATGQNTLTVGASVTLLLRPEGITAGDVEDTATAIITAVKVNSSNTDMNKVTFDWVGSISHGTISA